MFLTRLGFGSKMVVTGDVTQVDLPREQASGLIQVRDILAAVDGIAFVEFSHEDVVRHKLVQRIVEAYKQHAEQTGTAAEPSDRGRGRQPLAASRSTRRPRVELAQSRARRARASRTASSGSPSSGPDEAGR